MTRNDTTPTLAATLDPGPFANTEMDTLGSEKRRSMRARIQQMLVIPQIAGNGECIGMYDVHSLESGAVHTVVMHERPSFCSCRDMQYNNPDGGCKHIKRTAMAITETDLPAPSQQAGDYPTSIEDARQYLANERAEARARIEEIDAVMDPLGA